MKLPIVAIVGRPNVGKSSLFNRLIGRRISIVEATPGVTRDRVSAPLAVDSEGQDEMYVELVDTGGMGIEDMDDLGEHVEEQIAYALRAAALVVFVVDAREGVTPLDNHVTQQLRKMDTPVVLVANKIDEVDLVTEVAEFTKLGFGEPIPVSANHGNGIAELREAMQAAVGQSALPAGVEQRVELAIVGKRNAGKSTFINALAGEERVIASEVAGTTRDSVDVHLDLGEHKLTLIDTAGVRKKRKIRDDIEFYSHHRALRSIRRADVSALLIDASLPISQVDKHLAGLIAQEFKPVVLVINKWDLAQGRTDAEAFDAYLEKVLPEFAYAPVTLVSSQDGVNVRETIEVACQLYEQASTRLGTAELNEIIGEIVKLRGPSHKAGTKPPKILYATQIATCPPTIVCFVNDKRSFDRGYERFLVNRLREMTPFAEVPIRLLFRSRRREEQAE